MPYALRYLQKLYCTTHETEPHRAHFFLAFAGFLADAVLDAAAGVAFLAGVALLPWACSTADVIFLPGAGFFRLEPPAAGAEAPPLSFDFSLEAPPPFSEPQRDSERESHAREPSGPTLPHDDGAAEPPLRASRAPSVKPVLGPRTVEEDSPRAISAGSTLARLPALDSDEGG